MSGERKKDAATMARRTSDAVAKLVVAYLRGSGPPEKTARPGKIQRPSRRHFSSHCHRARFQRAVASDRAVAPTLHTATR
jgi:hypothetical protein